MLDTLVPTGPAEDEVDARVLFADDEMAPVPNVEVDATTVLLLRVTVVLD